MSFSKVLLMVLCASATCAVYADDQPADFDFVRYGHQLAGAFSSKSDLELSQFAVKQAGSASAQCKVGAAADVVGTILQAVPIASYLPTVGAQLADTLSGNVRSEAPLINDLDTLYDFLRDPSVAVTAAAAGALPYLDIYSDHTLLARFQISVAQANFTRLVGKNSGCQRATYAALYAALTLAERHRVLERIAAAAVSTQKVSGKPDAGTLAGALVQANGPATAGSSLY